MRRYSKPETKLIQNETLMAGKCNEQFIWSSAYGKQSAGFTNVCYHYQYYEKYTKQYCVDIYNGKIINIPASANVRFVDRERSGEYTENGKNYSMSSYKGWADFVGTNGTCHYLGYIYVNGILVDENNIGDFFNTSTGEPMF